MGDISGARPLLRAQQFCATRADSSGFDITLTPGARVGILGDAGSGKTTLLRALAHLQPPMCGRLWWDERDVTRKARWRLGKQRTFVTLLPTDPYASLEPWAAVRRFFTTTRESLAELFRQGGLPAIAADGEVRALSGMGRFRLSLLYTLQQEPRVLLADDVFRMLVPELWEPVLAELDAVAGATRALVIASRFWQALCAVDEVYVLDKGVVVECGTRTAVFAQPQHAHTRWLLEKGGDFF